MVISVAASWGQPKGDVGLEFRKKCRAGNRHLEVNYREVQLNAGDQTGSLGVFREGEAKSWYRSFTEISRPYSLYLLTEKYHLPSVKDGIGEGNGTPLQYSCLENPMDRGAWWAAVHGVVKSQTRLSGFTFTFHFHALEKEMATHSSVLAWRIPGTGEPGGLPSMGLHRVGHDWSDLAAAAFPLT